MKKYLIVAPGYPSKENIYNNGFVHSRAKEYISNGLNIEVFSIEKNTKKNYEYEGVKVNTGTYEDLENILSKNKYEKILVHFGFKKILQTIRKVLPTIEIIMWVHGVEALGWYRRLFTFDIKKPHRFMGYILINTRQLMFIHKFIKKDTNTHFVFVSEWMKNILETDSLTKGKIKKYTIIPNVVNEKTFSYKEKKKEDRLKILSIRPYHSKKYANDLTVETIIKLSTSDLFDDLEFNIYGEGRLFNKTLEPIKNFKNVNIYNKFLNHNEIKKEHDKNGIFLCPTRQDAQGVSMCEAMSSGLIVISSNNTAIPEYLNNEIGYLCNNVDEMKNSIIEMHKDPNIFIKKSQLSSEFIQEKCSSKVVITKEIKLIENNYEN